MARPGTNAGAGSSKGFFSGWKERRAAKKQEILDAAAKRITNDIAKNEAAIMETLGDIDFLHSRLPQECSELRGQRDSLIQVLSRPQTIKMDIRPIDHKLLTLSMMFKEAVEQGDVQAAYAAKAGLFRGIYDIRNRIPQNQPELARPFVEQNADYLSSWINLVNSAKKVDMEIRNLNVIQANNEKLAERLRKEEEEIQQAVLNDTEQGEAIAQIINHDDMGERKNWTPLQRETHRFMVEHSLNKNVFHLSDYTFHQKELELMTSKKQLAIMHETVNSVPVVIDPNLMNKQKEQIDKMIHSLAQADARIDETLNYFTELEGMVEQLEHAPGNENAKLRAQEEAAAVLEQIKQDQERVINPRSGSLQAIRAKYSLLTEEELERIKEENLRIKEAAKSLEVAAEETVEESELNYLDV